MTKYLMFLPILLASCGGSVGSAPVQPSFVMETRILRTSSEAKGLTIEVKPSDEQAVSK